MHCEVDFNGFQVCIDISLHYWMGKMTHQHWSLPEIGAFKDRKISKRTCMYYIQLHIIMLSSYLFACVYDVIIVDVWCWECRPKFMIYVFELNVTFPCIWITQFKLNKLIFHSYIHLNSRKHEILKDWNSISIFVYYYRGLTGFMHDWQFISLCWNNVNAWKFCMNES